MKFSSMFHVSDLREGEEDHGGWGVRVEPTKRLLKLDSHAAITILQNCVDRLKDLLAHYHKIFTKEDLENPDNLAKVRKVAFELDVSESYLAYLKKQHRIVH